MSADLPRPHTPGPWVVSTDAGEDSAEVLCMEPGDNHLHEVVIRQAGNHMAVSWPEGVEPSGAHPDIYAIAALPEWIAARDALAAKLDAVRALCEQALRDAADAPVYSPQVAAANFAIQVTDLLNGDREAA